MTEQAIADVEVQNEGSLFLFTMNTPAAREWVQENVQLEGWQMMGISSFAVDSRFAFDLASGMQASGLVVE